MKALLDHCLQNGLPTVLVVGDVMCDKHVWGKITRISPEAPVPVFEGTEVRQALGGVGNVAANLRALGCEVRLLGVIGADATGHCVRELLLQHGIPDTWLLEDSTRPTTEKTRIIAQQQQVVRLDQESRVPLSPSLTSQALKWVGELIDEVDGVVCSDYDKGMFTTEFLKTLFAIANAAGRPTFVDPKTRDFLRYRGATVVTPNLSEVELGSGMGVEDQVSLEKAVNLLLERSQSQALLVTRGKDGMSLFHPPQAPRHIATRAREVFDVTGAGDTVIATFSMAVLCGLSMEDAAGLANAAAGIVVGKIGTAVVSQDELRTALQDQEVASGGKVLRQQELTKVLQYHRTRGERIVFTNGCFDLLHVGHIHLLQQARALGERLVVGVNDDESVRVLKGHGRPLTSQEDRARILAGLAGVDYVTIFNDSTPLDLIKLVRPDVLVKGRGYTRETVVGREEVEAYGGRVHIVPSSSGVSTRSIIDHIVEHSC